MKKILFLLSAILLLSSCIKSKSTSVFEGTDSVHVAIQSWIDSMMYVDTTAEDCPSYFEHRVDALCIRPDYITLQYSYEGYYDGAAHGFAGCQGVTFYAMRIQPLDWESFLDENPRDEFIVKTNELLREQNPDVFFLEEGEQPLPQCPPFIVDDTCVLVYQQYEIAPYACGIITVKVPLNATK